METEGQQMEQMEQMETKGQHSTNGLFRKTGNFRKENPFWQGGGVNFAGNFQYIKCLKKIWKFIRSM